MVTTVVGQLSPPEDRSDCSAILDGVRRRNQPIASEPEPDEIPPWAMSSVLDWLAPFLLGAGMEAQGEWDRPGRDFVQEVERRQRLQLDWRNGRQGAQDDLWRRLQVDQQVLLDVLRFSCENILLGYSVQEYRSAGRRLGDALKEAGSAWEAIPGPGHTQFELRRRVSGAATAAVSHNTAASDGASEHLEEAWRHAYGRDPDPWLAYSEAVKAVEAATIPVVVPNDSAATLGKVIGNLRGSPSVWCVNLAGPVRLSGAGPTALSVDPIDIVIGQLDLLWANQTDRHAPVVAITLGQAQTAVHLALLLVHLFRSGAVARKP